MQGIVPKIFAAWRRPRQVMRAILADGQREDRALATLLGAATILFIAQWPRLSREAHLNPEVPLEATMAITLFALLFLAPLLFYTLAAASHLVARAFGGRGRFYGARMALFWSLLATAPWVLFQGLIAGFVGPGAALSVVSLAVFAAFAVQWGACLRVAEFEDM